MMKKLITMLAVLAMATVANAGLVLDPAEASIASGLNIQTDPIDAADVQQAVFLAVGGGGGALDAGTVVYGGSLSAISDLTGADPDLDAAVEAILGEAATRIDLIELFDGTATPPDVIGIVVSYGVTAEPGGTTPVALLNSETLEIMSSATIVPEPITIALLGLGGLFLRRRK
jgi:hypothetical protein